MQLSEPPFPDQLLKFQKGWMILQNMPDHQAPIEPLGCGAEFLGMLRLKRDRLFDEDMLARLERAKAERVILRRGHRERESVDPRIGEGLFEAERSSAVFPNQVFDNRFILIDESFQRADFSVGADVVLAPVTTT